MIITDQWPWCPLFGKLSFIKIPQNVPITRSRKIARCIDFIKEARNIWKCPHLEFKTNWPKPEEISEYPSSKTISARVIFNMLMTEYELIWNPGNSISNRSIETLLKNAIIRVRRLSKLDRQVSDGEIYAIFAILAAWNSLFLMLERGLPEDHLHVSATAEASYLSLSLAEQPDQPSQQQQQPALGSERLDDTMKISTQYNLKSNAFYKEDDTWFIRYEGEEFKPKDDYGFRYMAELLRTSPNGLTPEQLYHTVKGVEINKRDDKDAIKSAIAAGDLNKLHKSKFGKLTKKQREEYEKCIEEIKNEIESLEAEKKVYEDEGYEIKAEEMQEEIGRKRALLKETKPHSFDIEHKNKYNMVRNAIMRAMKKIHTLSKEKNYGSLLTSRHLKNSIKYDSSQFQYIPGKYPDWQF